MSSTRFDIENMDGLIRTIWTEPDCQLVNFEKGKTLHVEVSSGGGNVVARIRRAEDGTTQLWLYAPIDCEYSATIDGRSVHL